LVIESVDTEALAQNIAQTLTHQLTQYDARITIEPLPTVNADRIAMEQILSNLLGNAVKYLEPSRPGEITVRAECEADTTTFHVCDNGRGITEGDLPRVFELFRRVGRQDTPGEGMGLAYVQTLIRRHGGEITCQSTLGVGTIFSFTIANSLVPGGPDAN
jgi:signal transduction histidine kinase